MAHIQGGEKHCPKCLLACSTINIRGKIDQQTTERLQHFRMVSVRGTCWFSKNNVGNMKNKHSCTKVKKRQKKRNKKHQRNIKHTHSQQKNEKQKLDHFGQSRSSSSSKLPPTIPPNRRTNSNRQTRASEMYACTENI